MEKSPLLFAMQRIVLGIETESDFFRAPARMAFCVFHLQLEGNRRPRGVRGELPMSYSSTTRAAENGPIR
ncbi:hypothetical protein C5L14_25460 [Labrys okinawensis]|uniref:Uncharacterized protein n=1 Tax=Labrys okinawensis TaxID=346911 RepID=A0A2S9Q688_9HYPH|nr:hypothetical protein C5L14_25460 [Labrys okinawensis]